MMKSLDRAPEVAGFDGNKSPGHRVPDSPAGLHVRINTVLIIVGVSDGEEVPKIA
jgi:hypothetical protein